VDGAQATVAYLIAVVLVGLALYSSRQQWRTLRRLRSTEEIPEGERRYLRTQSVLRICCAGLMLVLAGLVAGAYGSGMEERAAELGRDLQGQRERGEEIVLTAEQKQFRKLYGSYWIAVLLLLLGVVVLAGSDIVAIRRYGRRQLSQLDADRQEMIRQQVLVLRSQRNGHP
jgi:ABC-type Fe3+ transport system permease subunit